jgi:hypothetical protein
MVEQRIPAAQRLFGFLVAGNVMDNRDDAAELPLIVEIGDARGPGKPAPPQQIAGVVAVIDLLAGKSPLQIGADRRSRSWCAQRCGHAALRTCPRILC